MVVSVAEFATPSPILSFGCLSAGKRMVKQTTEGVEVSVEEDMIENNDKREKTVVRLYFVQPNSLQECSIFYDNAAIRTALPPTLLERPRMAPVLVSPHL
jgi:formaldehyde-activating enzyme involved in methanogenesis